jgi:transposase, IS5 family
MPISAWKSCQRGAIRSKPLIISCRGRAFAPRSRRWCSHRTSLKKSSAGRKPFDAILMFGMLVLQALNNLSDEQVEYQVRDRLSFSRFRGLAIEDSIPDATTL